MVMMISLRTLKKSHMTFPRSPILPMQIPKVMKNPIRPAEKDWLPGAVTGAESAAWRWTLTQDVHAPLVLQSFPALDDGLCLIGGHRNLLQDCLNLQGATEAQL